MKKVLVLGGSGFIGKAIIKELLDDTHWDIYTTYNNSPSPLELKKSLKLDLSRLEDFMLLLKSLSPDIIISCMRGDFELQLKLHQEIAEYLKAKEGRVYFFSTANVFDKDNSKIHYETDQTGSISPYGIFKLTVENLLEEKLADKAIIIRLPQVLGKASPRLKQLKAASQSGVEITVYPNLLINTITDELVGQCTAYIIENDLKGIFHVTANDVMSHKSFYLKLIEELSLTNISLVDDEEEEGYFAIASQKNDQLPECFNKTNQYMISQI